jgi:type II secretory pathway predicted ATPase ExeA
MTRDILKLIHYLLNFETSDVKLLQVVLVGQEELADKVKRYKAYREMRLSCPMKSYGMSFYSKLPRQALNR